MGDFWDKYPDGVTLSRETMAEICPSCAEHMAFLGMKELKVSKQGLTPEQIQGLCERFGGEEGFHARCTESGGIQEAFDDPNQFCAWLKDQCHPGWRETDESEDDTERVASVKQSGVMVALYPDMTVAEALALRSEDSIPADQLHLTLAYLGEKADLPIETLSALPHLVHEWAAMAFPLEGRVSGMGRFSNGDMQPVYASVDMPGIQDIRHSLVSYLSMAGISVASDFDFVPHITLQYVEANQPSAVNSISPHAMRFDKVALSVGGERLIYPLGITENSEISTVGGPFFASLSEKAEGDESERIAYAAALVPGEADSDGEVLSAKDIERVAHLWMERYQNIDIQHSMNNVDVVPVESYITTDSLEVNIAGKQTTLPEGTWVIAGKARDEGVWEGIKSGALAGYSVMAVPGMAIKAASKSEKGADDEASRKARTLIRDLGPGWIVPFVSVVDRPAVPKAKWFAFKSAFENDLQNVPEESRGLITGLLAESRKMGEATYRQLATAVAKMTANDAGEENAMNEQEIRDLVKTEVGGLKEEVAGLKSALGEKPLAEQIADAIKEATPEGKAKSDDDGKNGDDDNANKNADESKDDKGSESANKNADEESEELKHVRSELEALKSQHEELVEEIGKRLPSNAAKSRSLSGQDGGTGDNTRSADDDVIDTSFGVKYRRDGFGRSIPVTK